MISELSENSDVLKPTKSDLLCSSIFNVEGMYNVVGHERPLSVISGSFQTIEPKQRNKHFAYLGYFAITVALAEFAAGNREAAIQLLEKEIRRQVKDQKDTPPSTDDFNDSCKRFDASKIDMDACKTAFRELDSKRRLVVRARLEVFEDNMMELTESSGFSDVRTPVLRHLVDDLDKTFDILDSAGNNRNLFTGAFGDPQATPCGQELANSIEEKELLARWTLARVVDKGNAVQTAGTHPEIVDVEPSLIATLDRYADSAANFDVKCATDLGAAAIPETQSFLMKAAAQYWEAKGHRFNRPEENLRVHIGTGESIAALCKARKLYVLAKRFYPEPNKPDEKVAGGPDINDNFDWFTGVHTISTLDDGVKRVWGALSAYPAAEVDKACP